jgi:hypothetical protein
MPAARALRPAVRPTVTLLVDAGPNRRPWHWQTLVAGRGPDIRGPGPGLAAAAMQ